MNWVNQWICRNGILSIFFACFASNRILGNSPIYFTLNVNCLPVLLPVLSYLLPVFRIFDVEPWQRLAIFSDYYDRWITVVRTLKPLLTLSLEQKKRVTISDYSLVAGIGLEPMTFGLWARRATWCKPFIYIWLELTLTTTDSKHWQYE